MSFRVGERGSVGSLPLITPLTNLRSTSWAVEGGLWERDWLASEMNGG